MSEKLKTQRVRMNPTGKARPYTVYLTEEQASAIRGNRGYAFGSGTIEKTIAKHGRAAKKRRRATRVKKNPGAEPSFNIRMAQTRRGADHYNKLTGSPRAYDDPLDALDAFPGDRIARERAEKERKRRRRPARARSSKRRKHRRPPTPARGRRRDPRRPGRGSAFVVELLKQTGRRLQFFYVTGKSLLASRARAKRFATEKEAIAAARCAIKGKSAQYRYARVLKA